MVEKVWIDRIGNTIYVSVYQHFKDFLDQIYLINYQGILCHSQDKLINYFLTYTKIYKLFIWDFLITEYNCIRN